MSYKVIHCILNVFISGLIGLIIYGICSPALDTKAKEPAPRVQHQQRVYRITTYSMTGAKLREWRSLSMPQGSLNFGKSFLDLDTGERVIFSSPYTAEIETR
jgi:hypothetical protein